MGYRCSHQQLAATACLVPILYGSIVLSGAFLDFDSQALMFVCLVWGALAIATGILGFLGVRRKIISAVEVTRILLILENLTAIMFGGVLLVDLSLTKRFTYGSEGSDSLETEEPSSEGTAAEQFLFSHKWIGYLISSLLIVLGFLGFVSSEILGTYYQDLQVDALLEEQKLMRIEDAVVGHPVTVVEENP